MINIFCPKCMSTSLQELGDGYYRCLSCGYEGSLGTVKEFFKK